MRKAIVVISGGMDSTVLAYQLYDANVDVELISFNYGQRHAKELTYAMQTAVRLGVRHDIIDMQSWGEAIIDSNSVLVAHNRDVPEGHYAEDNMAQTVVPNRNMVMLSMAVGVAVARKADAVATGVHAGDHHQYPDCRPDFIRHVYNTAVVANEGFLDSEFQIWAPFVMMEKSDIARLGTQLGVDWSATWSCYKGGDIHCGKCGTCVERLEALWVAHALDTTEYEDAQYWKTVSNIYR